MSGFQEELFCKMTQLFNEGVSNKAYLPYPFIGNSELSTVKTLVNMIFVGLNEVERESETSNQSKIQCGECPLLEAQLRKTELELSQMKEECGNLSKQLLSTGVNLFSEDGNLENALPTTPPRRHRSRSRTPLTPIQLRLYRERSKTPIEESEIESIGTDETKYSPSLLQGTGFEGNGDLAGLDGFDGGQRNSCNQILPRQNINLSASLSRNENLRLKRKSEDPEETDTASVDGDETIFKRSQNLRALGDSTLEMFDNFDKVPNLDTPSPGFAYKPERAIRKKAKRAELPGGDCDLCKKYYAAVQSQLTEGGVQQLKNNCSRHRSKHPVNLDGTPPNFWDVDFPSTSECIETGLLGIGKARSKN